MVDAPIRAAQFTIHHFAFRVFPSKYRIFEIWDTQTNKNVHGRLKLTSGFRAFAI
jgi:hypothetical protein